MGRNVRTDGRTDGRNAWDGTECVWWGGILGTGRNARYGMERMELDSGGIHDTGRDGNHGTGRNASNWTESIKRDGMDGTDNDDDKSWCRLRDDVGYGLLWAVGPRRQRVLPTPAAAAEARPAAPGGTSNSGTWVVCGWVRGFLFAAAVLSLIHI